MNQLEILRESLGQCDEIILDALIMRNRIIEDIMSYKEANDIPILQPEQEAKQKEWLERRMADRRHKAEVEAPYHELTRGGHIFYVEIDGDATHNPEVIMRVVDMMDQYNIGYGSVNHNRNRCLECGYENSTPNLEACPKCGSTHIDKLQRITGYLVGTTDRWNNAKLAELNDRVIHN